MVFLYVCIFCMVYHLRIIDSFGLPLSIFGASSLNPFKASFQQNLPLLSFWGFVGASPGLYCWYSLWKTTKAETTTVNSAVVAAVPKCLQLQADWHFICSFQLERSISASLLTSWVQLGFKNDTLIAVYATSAFSVSWRRCTEKQRAAGRRSMFAFCFYVTAADDLWQSISFPGLSGIFTWS